TVSLPRKKFQSERSRAEIRRTAGPSFKPASLEKSTVNFFWVSGESYCSETSGYSVPPALSVAENDFKPVPCSVTSISSGARPMVSVSGVILICGARHSKRGTRKYPPPITRTIKTAATRPRPGAKRRLGLPNSSALMDLRNQRNDPGKCFSVTINAGSVDVNKKSRRKQKTNNF